VVRTYNSINGVNNNVNTQINNNNRVNNIYNKSVIKLWVEDQNYVDIIINDINKIVNNKYLIIETLLRII
jgi:protoheme ferro-lyase